MCTVVIKRQKSCGTPNSCSSVETEDHNEENNSDAFPVIDRTCPVCQQSFPCESLLLSHRSTCGIETTASDRGRAHPSPRTVLGPSRQPHVCHFCPEIFASFTRLRAHALSVHGETRPLHCDTCGMSFKDRGVLRVHTEAKHSDKRHHCTICGKGFTAERKE